MATRMRQGGGKKSGGLKYAPGKIHYDSPKFLKAARRQARQEGRRFKPY